MTDSREKGARAETVVRDKLRELSGLGWERTPGSGALDAKHYLKGDLYVPNANNVYAVEVKHYKDDNLTSNILTGKSPILLMWWEQTVRQGNQMSKKPLLIFKHDRSKLFVAFNEISNGNYKSVLIDIEPHLFHVALLEEWYNNEKPVFTL